ncbi:MAG: 30S ribosomal protein S21 [Mariprofundales bacterium]
MPGIKIEHEDDFEFALKRFRKQAERGGVISECRRREAYEKPSIKAKRKAIAAQKRLRKRLRRMRMRDSRDY